METARSRQDEPPEQERRATEDTKRRVEREATAHNPDPTTRREALEQELIEEDRSEVGEEIGDEMD
jgi:hypothetical protein